MLDLTNKTAKEKAQIKANGIAQIKIEKFKKNDIEVEIIDNIKEIEINGNPGIEFFATAFKNGKQLGFGKDGSIQIERFRVYNPPILVDDPLGEIVREWVKTDVATGEKTNMRRTLREDLAEATRLSLIHTIGLVGIENADIVIGKIGNTTSTFYPAAGANSPVDGRTVSPEPGSWSANRAAAGNESYDSVTDDIVIQSEEAHSTSYPLSRCIFLFNTGALPDTDDIDSATFSIYAAGWGNNSETNYPADLAIVASNPASNSAIVNNDYNIAGWGTTEFASRLDLGTFIGSAAYHDFALNSSGKLHISKTGISKFGIRATNDLDNNTPTLRSYGGGYYADEAGTNKDPKLVVVHSEAAASSRPAPQKMMMGMGV